MKLRTFSLVAGLAAASIGLAGCGDTTANTNVRTNTNAVTNLGTDNANIGAVVVNNNANLAGNRWANTNITREEYDRRRAEYERDRGDDTIGTGANDSWLWFKTRAALTTADDVRDSTIDVDVENGVVTLRGTVETAAEKTRAVQAAKGVEDVTRVVDQLKVAPEDSMTNSATGNTAGNRNAR